MSIISGHDTFEIQLAVSLRNLLGFVSKQGVGFAGTGVKQNDNYTLSDETL